jgi:1,5-anhydro-D-fructose reductase (1,5-anhydro-D-mannitol-forming)
MYDARFSQRRWLQERKTAGGGAAFDIGVHCLDTLRFVLEDEVNNVTGAVFPPPSSGRTEESALMGLQFSRGTIGAIFCSYASSLRRKQLEIIGTQGLITAGDFTAGTMQSDLTIVPGTDATPGTRRVEPFTIPNLLSEEISHFIGAVFEHRETDTPGENGLANQRVLDAILNQGTGKGIP